MPKEKSVGAVVYTIEEGRLEYLLLYYPKTARTKSSYWDLPKGHVEEGESEIDTARREVEEETGLENVTFKQGFRMSVRYFFRSEGKTIFKTVMFYVAQAHRRKIIVSHEHAGYVWLPFRDALRHVKYQNAKEVITKAHNFLSRESVRGNKKNSSRGGSHVQRRGRVHRKA